MRIPDSVIEEVARRTDIVELVGGYVTLKPSGARYMGLCPFHSEKTPSFSVNPEMGAFYCFGCHKGGSVFNFVMEIEGLTFPESVKLLADRAGVEFSPEEDSDASRRRSALLELYSRVAGSFEYVLRESESAAEVRQLLADRGISEESINEFAIGYSPADPYWLHAFLTKKQYSADFLKGCGLFTRANDKRALFAGRIMFPIRNRRGKVVAFGGRLVAGEGPKYINSPETEIFRKGEELYGFDKAVRSIRSEKRVVLCEGYTDVVAFHQSGITSAVAPLGTAMTDQHGRTLAKICRSAVLVFDGDAAGIQAAERSAVILESNGVDPFVVALDTGIDPADIVKNKGSHALRDTISSPLTALEFLVRTGLVSGGASGPAAKSIVLERVFPYISVMRSEVRRSESVRLTADLVGVDRTAVERDFARYRRGGKRGPRGAHGSRSVQHEQTRPSGREIEPSTRTKFTSTSHELYLMLATAANREQFAFVRRWIQPEDLQDPAAREIYVSLEESFRRDETSLDVLLNRISGPEIVDMVRLRLASGEFDGIADEAFRDGVAAIRRRSIEEKIRDVELRLRRLESGNAADFDQEELLGEKMYLDKELQKLKGEGA